jgi:anti-sigma B factor antagonist
MELLTIMPSDHLIVEKYEGLVLAKITKERILDPSVIVPLGDDLMREIDRHSRLSMVLDLSGVGYMSSAFIGRLIALHKGIVAAKGRLAIAGVRPAIQPIFKAMHLEKIMTFYPEAEAAILYFRRKPL